MLDIVLFAFSSPTVDLPISSSTNQVRAMAMSNFEGSTPSYLLPQVNGTTALDEDVDLKLSDEELELIAGAWSVGCRTRFCSDVIIGRRVIVDYDSFRAYIDREPDGWKQIDYIRQRFQANRIRVGTEQVYAVIWQQLRDLAPVQIKQARNGFTVDLETGQLFYNR